MAPATSTDPLKTASGCFRQSFYKAQQQSRVHIKRTDSVSQRHQPELTRDSRKGPYAESNRCFIQLRTVNAEGSFPAPPEEGRDWTRDLSKQKGLLSPPPHAMSVTHSKSTTAKDCTSR